MGEHLVRVNRVFARALTFGVPEDMVAGCMDWLAEAQELAQAGQPFALATVVRRMAPASAQPGAQSTHPSGWIDAGLGRRELRAASRHAVRRARHYATVRHDCSGSARCQGLATRAESQDREDVVEYPMTCHSGGALEILIEPVLPAPRLFIVGETPIVETLADLARVMGYRVNQFDHAADLTLRLGDPGPPVFVVVASMGVDDEEALAAALRAGTPYVALVASPKRAAVVRETLAAMGVSPHDLAPAQSARRSRYRRAHARGDRPQHHGRDCPDALGDDARDRQGISAEEPESAALELEAIDPVCGMTVTIAGARHQTEYDGKIWYFCCGGCKARFEADPLSYLPA